MNQDLNYLLLAASEKSEDDFIKVYNILATTCETVDDGIWLTDQLSDLADYFQELAWDNTAGIKDEYSFDKALFFAELVNKIMGKVILALYKDKDIDSINYYLDKCDKYNLFDNWEEDIQLGYIK